MALMEPVLEALDAAFKKYEVEARAPTALLTSVAEILAEQSVFLPDFSPGGVKTKIKQLFSKPVGEYDASELSSLSKSMDEILEALVRDEATRLLISPQNENNSLGQLVLGTKNRNEYLETLRVYMADETSKSFMVSVADTAFELLQRVIGKTHAFAKNLSSGYALWEVPFNAPGKHVLISLDQCPVVLKRAWQRPTKIYFLTTQESKERFASERDTGSKEKHSKNSPPPSPNTASRRSHAHSLKDSHNIETSALSSSTERVEKTPSGTSLAIPRAASPSPSPKSPSSIKIFTEDGNFVSLSLGKSERCESVKRRACSKFGSLLDDSFNYGVWIQLQTTSNSDLTASGSTTLKTSTSSISNISSSDDGLSHPGKAPISPSAGGSGKVSTSGTSGSAKEAGKDKTEKSEKTEKSKSKSSKEKESWLVADEEDMMALLVKYAGGSNCKFLLKPIDVKAPTSPKPKTVPSLKHGGSSKDIERAGSLDPAAMLKSKKSPTASPQRPRAVGGDSHGDAYVASGSPGRRTGSSSSGGVRRGSFSMARVTSQVTHTTPDFITFSQVISPRQQQQHRVMVAGGSGGAESSESSTHTVYSEARTFELSLSREGDTKVLSASPGKSRLGTQSPGRGGNSPGSFGSSGGVLASSVTAADARDSESEQECMRKAVEQIQLSGHRTTLSLQGLALTRLPSELRDLPKHPRYLDLSHNRLSTLPDWLNSAYSLCRGLNLSANLLASIEPLDGLKKIRTLDLSGNCLRKMPALLCDLVTLSRLYLNFNQLSKIPKTIGKLTGLKEFAIAGNQLTTLPPTMGRLASLELLDIGYNNISDVSCLTECRRLAELFATSNPLNDMAPILKFTALETLDLSCTAIASVPSGIGSLTRLVDLDLSQTPIASESDVPVEELESLPLYISTRWPMELDYLTDRISSAQAMRAQSSGASDDSSLDSGSQGFASPSGKMPSLANALNGLATVQEDEVGGRSEGSSSSAMTVGSSGVAGGSSSAFSPRVPSKKRRKSEQPSPRSRRSKSRKLKKDRPNSPSPSDDKDEDTSSDEEFGMENDGSSTGRRLSNSSSAIQDSYSSTSDSISVLGGSVSTSALVSSSSGALSSLSPGRKGQKDRTNAFAKRRTYSQKRYSTLSDVKMASSAHSMLISADHAEGYNVEFSRGRLAMGDLSFAPANLRLLHGLDEYFTHFYDQNHTNFLAIDKNLGVLIISLLFEVEYLKGEEVHRILIKSQNGDKTIWLPSVLLRSSSKKTAGLSAASMSSVSPKSISYDRVIEFIVEHQAGVLQLASIKHLADAAISKEILDYESRMNYNAFKFGVLYAGVGTTEEEFYSNTHPSAEFSNFIDFLGDTIRLQGWPHFSGGLDVEGNRTGRLSIYKRWASLEMMFHVSTLLPYAVDDPQQIERKKHIGNDVVVILFQDEDAPPFQPSCMKSYFNHVYVVVRPLRVNHTFKYTVAVASKIGVHDHSPYLPEPAFFDLNADFRRFLYTKLVNAERSSYEAPNFAKALCRTRLQLLQEFSSIHASNTLNKKIRLKNKTK
jgi:RAP1 GTPase activating protein 1